jgi:hypothetical protein
MTGLGRDAPASELSEQEWRRIFEAREEYHYSS